MAVHPIAHRGLIMPGARSDNRLSIAEKSRPCITHAGFSIDIFTLRGKMENYSNLIDNPIHMPAITLERNYLRGILTLLLFCYFSMQGIFAAELKTYTEDPSPLHWY